MFLYHYFDKDIGPFKNISELSEQDAENVMRKLALEKEKAFCNQRSPEYFKMRKYYEEILRNEFQKKGGKIERLVPHYMVVEECGFLESWYVNSSSIKIDINEFDISTLSFTYGDSHPTFFLYKGCELTVRQALVSMLLPSGNDAAYALAAFTGRKI